MARSPLLLGSLERDSSGLCIRPPSGQAWPPSGGGPPAWKEGGHPPHCSPSARPAQQPARWSVMRQALWPRGLRQPGPWGSLVSTPLQTAVGKLSSTLGSRNFLHSCPAQSVWQREKQGFSELKLHGYHGALGCLCPRTELPWSLPGLA